jgi:hypothetical protein
VTENSHTISHTIYPRFCDLRSAILYHETIFRETTVQFSVRGDFLKIPHTAPYKLLRRARSVSRSWPAEYGGLDLL